MGWTPRSAVSGQRSAVSGQRSAIVSAVGGRRSAVGRSGGRSSVTTFHGAPVPCRANSARIGGRWAGQG
ncbi:hypothetical protein CVT30_25300 [Streptomyces sp. AMCC400023]|nr:hypothetical protein CVT30_25300 [Streptomyces sp. AMCC400023]